MNESLGNREVETPVPLGMTSLTQKLIEHNPKPVEPRAPKQPHSIQVYYEDGDLLLSNVTKVRYADPHYVVDVDSKRYIIPHTYQMLVMDFPEDE